MAESINENEVMFTDILDSPPYPFTNKNVDDNKDIDKENKEGELANDIVEEETENMLGKRWWENDIPSGKIYSDYLNSIYKDDKEIDDSFGNYQDEIKKYSDLLDANIVDYEHKGEKKSIGCLTLDKILTNKCEDKDKDKSITVDAKFEVPKYEPKIDIQKIREKIEESKNEIKDIPTNPSITPEQINKIKDELTNAIDFDVIDNSGEYPKYKPVDDNDYNSVLDKVDAVIDNAGDLLEEMMISQLAKNYTEQAIENAENELASEGEKSQSSEGGESEGGSGHGGVGGGSVGMIGEAEPLVLYPPAPFPKFMYFPWLWIMASLVHFINQMITQITINCLVQIPLNIAGGVLLSSPPVIIPIKLIDEGNNAAEHASTTALLASVKCAGAILASISYFNLSSPWILPPIIAFPPDPLIPMGPIQTFSDPSFVEPETKIFSYTETANTLMNSSTNKLYKRMDEVIGQSSDAKTTNKKIYDYMKKKNMLKSIELIDEYYVKITPNPDGSNNDTNTIDNTDLNFNERK